MLLPFWSKGAFVETAVVAIVEVVVLCRLLYFAKRFARMLRFSAKQPFQRDLIKQLMFPSTLNDFLLKVFKHVRNDPS
jgi:hypothetical protein